METLTNLLPPKIRRPPYDAILWWEVRRALFNAVVVIGSVASFVVIELIGARYVEPGADVLEPMLVLFGGAFVIIAANVCYTLGWVTELMWSEGDTSRTEAVRARVYRRGMMFSAGIAVTPGVVMLLAWLLSAFR